MTTANITFDGKYYDGEFPVSHSSQLIFNDSNATLCYEENSKAFIKETLLVSPRIGNADRFITFADGGQYQCADHPFLDQLPQEIKSEGPVAWLEKHLSIAIISIILTGCSLLIGYIYGLPAATNSLIKRLPISTEAKLGQHAMSWLDESTWFQKSQLSQEEQESITDRFNLLHKELVMSPHISLEFRDSKIIGPNAFALPGGTIIITDQMVAKAENTDEILAILSHELGHIEGRHSLRKILQSSVVALTVATITGDAASLSAVVVGLPAALVQSQYSRELETEADNFAFNLLKGHEIPTESFANIMERLDKDDTKSTNMSFLATHPITSERLKNARAADKRN